MANTLAFYNDAGLTSQATSIVVTQAVDGSAAPVDRVVYLGSTASGTVFEAASNPGVDNITVSITDSAPGSGVEAAHVKLALTNGGLSSATPGAALSVGTSINSGPGNGVAINLRVDTPALAFGLYAQIALQTNTTNERL